MRAWIHAEENKRRTLQRSDIASALAKSDMFDFLIDIVPREEAASHAKRSGQGAAGAGAGTAQASSTGQIIPPQNNVQQQPPPGHPQQQQPQHMGHPDYPPLDNRQMAQEQDFRTQPGMYTPQVQPDPTAYQPQQPYLEGMYGYTPMPTAQQVSGLKLDEQCWRRSLTILLRCIRSIKELRTHLEDKIRATSTKDMTEAKEMQTLRASGIMKLDEACGDRAQSSRRCYSSHSSEQNDCWESGAKHKWIGKPMLVLCAISSHALYVCI